MKLRELLGNKDNFGLSRKVLDTAIRGITCDSRNVKKGYIFFAISGNKLKGRDFVPEAIRKGARVVVIEKDTKVNKEAKDIIFVKKKAITHTIKTKANMPGQRTSKTPALVAIPLPPLNLRNSVQLWPQIAAKPIRI